MFSMHKRPGAVNRMNPPGLVENILGAAATVSLKGEGGGWVSEGGSWKGLLCIFIGSTITTIPTANLAVPHCTSGDELVLEQRPRRHSELFRTIKSSQRQAGRGGGAAVSTQWRP